MTFTDITGVQMQPFGSCGRTVDVSAHTMSAQNLTYDPTITQDNFVGTAASSYTAEVNGAPVPVFETKDFLGSLNGNTGTLTFVSQGHYTVNLLPVPALSTWAAAIALVLLLVAGTILVRRRRSGAVAGHGQP